MAFDRRVVAACCALEMQGIGPTAALMSWPAADRAGLGIYQSTSRLGISPGLRCGAQQAHGSAAQTIDGIGLQWR